MAARCGLFRRDGGASGVLLLQARVSTSITDFLACVTLVQTFENASGAPLEAVYSFPLDDRAAVHGLRAEVRGRGAPGRGVGGAAGACRSTARP